ncbi:MAG: SpoIIE family protein phosphatase [Candidatus Gracilibacteria bacterium]
MIRSLKAKFTLAFGTLTVVLFLALGMFLVNAKTEELSQDISTSTQNFASLTVSKVMENYTAYLEPGNFLPFSREISGILRKNEDVPNISITSYSGVILYDSIQEKIERYSDGLRTVTDQETSDRIQSNKSSVLYQNGRILYLKVDENKNVSYVDFNEKSVESPALTDRVVDIIVPYQNAYAVSYTVSYELMDERLREAKIQIGVIAGIGTLLTLMISFMLAVSITNPLKALTEGALRIASGDFGTQVIAKTKDEIGVLAETFNQMAKDLAASLEVKLYKERVTKELELASKIQNDLLPKGRLDLESLDVTGGLHPATEIGGDAFDFIQMDDGDHLIYLGDVSGHGVPAGIISSIANGLLYALRGETDLKEIASRINSVIQKKSSNTMFMTMALTEWNEKDKTLKYVNLGHLPLLYYDAENKKVMEIHLPGMALGLADELKNLQEQVLNLKPNDIVIMYSDGIPEARDAKNEQYGMQRLKRITQQAGDDLLTAEAIKNALFSDVMQFIGDQDHLDDITLVVMKRKG